MRVARVSSHARRTILCELGSEALFSRRRTDDGKLDDVPDVEACAPPRGLPSADAPS